MAEIFAAHHILIAMFGALLGVIGMCILIAGREDDRIEPKLRPIGHCRICKKDFYVPHAEHYRDAHHIPRDRKVSGGLWL